MKRKIPLTKDLKIGLVFSGGGARGAWQVGAWKAMRELGIDKNVTMVAGTSIGAINGAAFVQGELILLEDIWASMEFQKIFTSIKEKRNLLLKLGREIIKQRGADVNPLKKLIRNYINEDKIYNSPVGYSLVTVNVTKRKFEYIRKKDVPKGELTEYIIASSTFPLFKRHLINKHKFVDGGIYNNIPLDECVNHSSEPNVIICLNVTNISSLNPFRIYDYRKLKAMVNLVDLKPSVSMGSILNFEKKNARRFLKIGYEDALKMLQENFNFC